MGQLASSCWCWWNRPIPVLGAGASLPSRLYKDAIAAYHFVNRSVQVSYAVTGSGGGKCRIKGSCPEEPEPTSADFAGSDSLLTDAEYEQYPDLQMYPTVAGAVVPIYSLPGPPDLILSTQALAQIFRSEITTWDDPRIVALNPAFQAQGIPPGQRIEVVVRSDKSGTTEIFKKALAQFDPVFGAQVGTSSRPEWRNVTATRRAGNRGVAAHVRATPYAIGYCVRGEALDFQQPAARLRKASGAVVAASQATVQYAVMELGVSFGNNGDPPGRLTADIHGARGAQAWPICGYTYLVLRKAARRPGADCGTVHATVAFWLWFYGSDVVKAFARDHGLVVLPEVVREAVVDRLRSDIVCEARCVGGGERRAAVVGAVPPFAHRPFAMAARIYNTVDAASSVSVSFDYSAQQPHFVVTPVAPAARAAPAALVFAAMGLALLSAVELELDMVLLARILDGDVTEWRDPAIAARNPRAREVLAALAPAMAPDQRIALLCSAATPRAVLRDLMRQYRPAATGAALSAARVIGPDAAFESAALADPFALAIGLYAPDQSPRLRAVRVARGGGPAVGPSVRGLRACASADAWDDQLRSFRLPASGSAACYPLAFPLYLTAPPPDCAAPPSPSARATAHFVRWLAAEPRIRDFFAGQFVVTLLEAVPAAARHNAAAVGLIACPRSHEGYMWSRVVIAVVGGVVLAAGGAFAWKSTARWRLVRRQASECVHAIARLDLEALQWLYAIKKPNKVQVAH